MQESRGIWSIQWGVLVNVTLANMLRENRKKREIRSLMCNINRQPLTSAKRAVNIRNRVKKKPFDVNAVSDGTEWIQTVLIFPEWVKITYISLLCIQKHINYTIYILHWALIANLAELKTFNLVSSESLSSFYIVSAF